jgi:subtilase family serine protease
VFPVRFRPSTAVGLVVVVAALVATSAASAFGTASIGRSPIAGSKPAWVDAATVAKTTAVAAATQEQAKVWLAPRNASQLTALATAVSDPKSPQYRQFITHDQYVAQFAPTADQIAAVSNWLTQAGLAVDEIGPDNHFVAVSGTAAAMNAAFDTQLAMFSVNGQQEQAPAQDLSVPDTVAPFVLAVTGLSTFGHLTKPADLGAPDAFVNGTPCSAYYGAQMASDLPGFPKPKKKYTVPYAVCGYVPSQLRGAYGVTATGLTGAGQTVAITDAFDASTLLADANTYAPLHGDSAFAAGQFSDNSVPENAALAGVCGGNGWYGEQTLDIEAVHGMAPMANVAYYGAASCTDADLLSALAQVVSDNTASIVTNSWGEPTYVLVGGVPIPTIDLSLVLIYTYIFKQGAVQGIGFYFSSGDDGDNLAAWGVLHPDWPAESPWVTAVGGTALGIGASNQRVYETGWGTSKWSLIGGVWTQTVPFQYGAGGGFTNSSLFMQPSYQDGVVKHNPTGGRAVPDISMVGDPTTGMLVGETQTFSLASRYGAPGVHYGEYRIGGTSLSSPLFAGVQAVVQSAGGGRIGFANPMIYSFYSLKHPVAYFDVGAKKQKNAAAGNVRADFVNGQNGDAGTVFSVRTFNQDSSLMTSKGWDDVTGVGSVTPNYIAMAAG